MCSMYWTLDVKVKCPKCGRDRMWDLQTHFMGYPGSCMHHYKLDEKIDELEDVSVVLDGRIDDFIGDCPNCDAKFDLGAEIANGTVKRVFILNKQSFFLNKPKMEESEKD